MEPSEHGIQSASVEWFQYQYPRVLGFSIPNGGHLHIAQAVKLKAEGMKAGVPDFCIAKAAGPFHGLYLEVKRSDGKMSKDQKLVSEHLRNEGYRVDVVRSVDDFRESCVDYLSTGAFKEKVVKAEWWLAQIRQMRCLANGCMAQVCDPHHLLKMRHRDDMAVPICREHHTHSNNCIHKMGEWKWMMHNDTNLFEILHTRLMPEFECQLARR